VIGSAEEQNKGEAQDRVGQQNVTDEEEHQVRCTQDGKGHQASLINPASNG